MATKILTLDPLFPDGTPAVGTRLSVRVDRDVAIIGSGVVAKKNAAQSYTVGRDGTFPTIDVVPNDDATLQEWSKGYALIIDAEPTPRGGITGGPWTVVVTSAQASAIRMSDLEVAQPVPSQFTTIGAFMTQLEGIQAAADAAAADAHSVVDALGGPSAVDDVMNAAANAAAAQSDAADSAAAAAASAALVGAPAGDAIDAHLGGDATGLAVTVSETARVTPPLTGVSLSTEGSGVRAIDVHDGIVYGSDANTIYRSADNAATWTAITTTGFRTQRLFLTSDGEAVINDGSNIRKSSGWGTGTITWTIKVTKSAPAGPGILQWGIDGDGTKFIATEYSDTDRTQSRYVWVSTDSGNTWPIVLDKYTIDPTSTSHMHGVCYDKWEDRFWLSHGHGVIRGTYYSNDDGATWSMIGGDFQPDAAPCTLCATDDGIVAGSDSNDGGVYGIARAPLAQLEMRRVARWVTTHDGVAGFANRSYRDPATGIVYTFFESAFADLGPTMFASNARAGAEIWRGPVKVCRAPNVILTPNRTLVATIDNMDGSYTTVKAAVPNPGTVTPFDSGNTGGGESAGQTSVSIGPGSTTASGFAGQTTIGTLAGSTADKTVAIGSSASAGGARATVIGSDSASTAPDTTVVGQGTTASASFQVLVGRSALASASVSVVAVGDNAAAAGNGTALGRNARAGWNTTLGGTTTAYSGTVAIGTNSQAQGSLTVAIGSSASTTGGNSIAVGNAATAQSSCVVIGPSAASNGVNQVLIGSSVASSANATGAVAIGDSAAAGGTGTAIGRLAKAGWATTSAPTTNYADTVAIGVQAEAQAAQGTAIGRYAISSNTNSVAIGYQTTTSAGNQVSVGSRHLQMGATTGVLAAVAGTGRVYIKDNGSGKMQLVVQFPTGSAITLATEA